jgi:CheY-like chemotaxis protein
MRYHTETYDNGGAGMNIRGLPMYYYPTTVMLLDDSEDFLVNFSSQLQANFALTLYSQPQAALIYLKDMDDSSHICQTAFTNVQELGGNNPITNHAINLDLCSIQDEIYNPKRFSEVAVIIVDDDMPGIDGLDFCRALKGRPFKKILLTSHGNEKMAIEAFNEGAIDLFLQKNQHNIVQSIEQSIINLQQQYFESFTADLRFFLKKQGAPFINDPIFLQFFFDLCRKHHIVEYYLTEVTGSFLLLDADAKANWLVVKCYDDLSIHYEFAQDNDAPESALAEIRAGNKIPFSSNANDYFNSRSNEEWEKHLYPAEEIRGKEVYYYALIKPSEATQIDSKRIYSYHQYLEQLAQTRVINH